MIGYYFITDGRLSRAGILSDAKEALRAGVRFVQYRNKCAGTRELCEEALALRKICSNARLIINDRVDVALAVKADGVHLGAEDMPYLQARRLLGGKKIIGLTVHSVAQALEAQKAGADYIGVAPIFETATKQDAGKPKGVKLIRQIKRAVKIPLVAIGGIDLSNAADVIESGADGLCAISAVVTKRDVFEEIKKFNKLFG